MLSYLVLIAFALLIVTFSAGAIYLNYLHHQDRAHAGRSVAGEHRKSLDAETVRSPAKPTPSFSGRLAPVESHG